eukprot:3977891-Prymnesium_polylepis.1
MYQSGTGAQAQHAEEWHGQRHARCRGRRCCGVAVSIAGQQATQRARCADCTAVSWPGGRAQGGWRTGVHCSRPGVHCSRPVLCHLQRFLTA